MPLITLRIQHESVEHDEAVEALGAQAFGPGRFARAAFRLREGVAPERDLSFVALMQDGEGREELVGSIRLTAITIGGKPALVLGPLVVAPHRKSIGIGRELMNRAMTAARAGGHRFVILVGDLPYYSRFGFQTVPHGRITLPGPADPARTLYCELVPGAAAHYSGAAARDLQPRNTDEKAAAAE
jgi:predicted N-acetyltransferase YhbS